MTRDTLHFDEQIVLRSREAARSARDYCASAGYPLGVAMIDEAWFGGDMHEVLVALSAYQNPDGGFGNGLEVDITAPASNAFAARLAMHVLLGLKTRSASTLQDQLAGWLVANQAEDGDWHFSAEVRTGELAPWFAGWTFPALNPACCIAGLADRLGIATPEMLDRVARLFAEKASATDVRDGDFYTLLPYVEYAGVTGLPDRDEWVERITSAIAAIDAAGGYGDPQHYFEHALGSGPLLLHRLDPDRVLANASLMLARQSADGGWPSPYSESWRPWLTAWSSVVLSQLAVGR